MLTRWNGYEKGINLGGWLSQCDHKAETYDNFISEEDFKTISGWGLDHVRVPVDYNLVEDEQGRYIEKGFLYIEDTINMCRKYKLKMVLDLHKTAGYSFDKGEHESGFFDDTDGGRALRERYFLLWEQFARRFSGDYEMLAFELLNEITDQAYSSIWNETIKECVSRIRKYSEDIDIIYGGYWYNSVDAVKDLPVIDDPHVMYAVHNYDPFKFTHQGARWVDPKTIPHDARPTFDEFGITTDDFINRFAECVNIAKERGVRLYCSEYGVICNVTPEDTIKYYKAINAAFKYYGIPRAAWTYRSMAFGLADSRLDDVREEVLKYM
ncbi:MAG: glycoside hydrolase family 5 protein [Lachnospiraceae bacterium]|nr:glycoside hydrolase family 5 protein [Lachnospiraceae bacterium]